MIRPPAVNAVAGLGAVAALVAALSAGAVVAAGLSAVVVLVVAGQAVLLARRDRAARAGRRERRDRARRRVAAAEREHRRVAGQLRDSVLQDLAGVGYALGDSGGELAGVVQGTIRTLRQILVDVEPPELTGDTLAAAVDDLTAGLRMAGTVCVVRVPTALPLAPAGAGLLWRAAREALRAAESADGVTRVEITVAADATAVTLRVVHDGDPTAPPSLLLDAFAEAGGQLTTAPTTATVPARR
jgi:signal transduction histidine kinase